MRRLILVVLLLALLLPAQASASRKPTPAERRAIAAVLPQQVRYAPAACELLALRVANDGRWATVRVKAVNVKSCGVGYGERGYYLERRRHGHWSIAYHGLKAPCALKAPQDLLAVCARSASTNP